MDTKSQTVTVGGGALFSDVIPTVLNAGYEIGSDLHGLTADTVVSYKVVTAAGKIMTVSDFQNADLFWAMRVAGQNFGIVLETTYKIFKVTNGGKALNVDLILPASANGTHWGLIKKLSINMLDELSMFTGRQLLAPIIANNPLVTKISYINAIDLIPTSLFGRFNDPMCKKSNHVSTYTVGLKQIDISTFNTMFHDMADFWKQYPQTTGSTIYYQTLPVQAVKAVPSGFNSYPTSHREIETHVLMTYNYNDASIDAIVSDFADKNRQNLAKTSGFSELELYTTYAHGDEGAKIWYRDSLPRLQELKKYDLENRFRFFNPIVA
ncbi:FAD-binding domain-containing protein [Emericellopsis cladophorae]|uniref:FAD-binding domain-containing protein n=1 Tax=Emericellopsis cladophorae TaxID=2686198 RepID=A0A9P9Y1Q9_9HYPO|nr:FAD-binding domain-containing protein [Emericellopsis cladophorae]KAI6781553.1 FAD-binding domain-containing protein [Emericellopsis cladophorae]